MNFLFTVAVFWLFSAASYFVSRATSSTITSEVLVGFSIGFFVIGMIVSVVAVFQNFYLREEQKRDLQSIRTFRKKIEVSKRAIETYKSEISNSLTKLYPEYEKEMFKNMSPVDAEHLDVYLAKYPELKFSGVLKTFTDEVTRSLHEISSYERDIEYAYSNILNRHHNGWYFMKVPLPVEVTNA